MGKKTRIVLILIVLAWVIGWGFPAATGDTETAGLIFKTPFILLFGALAGIAKFVASLFK